LERCTEFKERQYVFNVDRLDIFNGGPDCPGFKSLHPFAWPILLSKYSVDVDECASTNKICEVMSLDNFMSFNEFCIDQ